MKRLNDISRKVGSGLALLTAVTVVLCALALLLAATIKLCYWFVEPVFAEADTHVVVEQAEGVQKTRTIEEACGVTQEETELIALVTMAEAEGECEEGKRLVIDTILNRVDSERFPDSIHDVVYQPNQFEAMWNGRVDRCEVREDICQLVREELASRTNSDVIFFMAGQYSAYGEPLIQVGNHYFSKY